MSLSEQIEHIAASGLGWISNNFHLLDFAALLGIITLIFQLQNLIRSSRADEARLYFEIAQRWSDVLGLIYEMRQDPPPPLEQLEAEYDNVQAFMATELWQKKYRPICNFFEDIGLMVHKGTIPIGELKVLVTVLGDDYLKLSPVIKYIRIYYRKDIYLFWNYLLQQSARNESGLDPFKGRSPFVPVPKEDAAPQNKTVPTQKADQ